MAQRFVPPLIGKRFAPAVADPTLLVVIILSVLVGIAASARPHIAVIAAALLAWVVYALLSVNRPRIGTLLLFASLALVPTYVLPDLGGGAGQPSAAFAVALAIALANERPRPRGLTGIDVTFGALCSVMIVGAVVGPPTLRGTLSTCAIWTVAYVAGRLICQVQSGRDLFIRGAAWTGLLSVPFIAVEHFTGTNAFLSLPNSGSPNAILWARQDFRGGAVLRPEGAFGHPLSMAFVVAGAAVFAMALAMRAQTLRTRWSWIAATLLLVAAQATSNERTGWIVFAGGALFVLLTAVPKGSRFRFGFKLGLVALPILLLVFALSDRAAGPATSVDIAVQQHRTSSLEYRTSLYRHALDPGALSLFGRGNNVGTFADEAVPGATSLDSALLQVAVEHGVISAIALLALFVCLMGALVRFRGSPDAVFPAVALASSIALAAMGFQTQQIVWYWLCVGAVSGAWLAKSRTPPASRTAQDLEPQPVSTGRPVASQTA